MIILGIDPGIAITGWGIIGNEKRGVIKARDFGAIYTEKKESYPQRLDKIFTELKRIIRKFQPDTMALEELFFAKNLKTATNVGQARGIVILAAVRSGIQIAEYTPLEIKQAIVGYGQAKKLQIQGMVKSLLNLKEIPRPDDVADALAVAICHAHTYKTISRMKDSVRRDVKCLHLSREG